jgi:hypothetical protein
VRLIDRNRGVSIHGIWAFKIFKYIVLPDIFYLCSTSPTIQD